jgi:hypothetical protein
VHLLACSLLSTKVEVAKGRQGSKAGRRKAPFFFVQAIIDFQGRTVMTIVRGTNVYVGKEANEMRNLEQAFRSYLH